MTHLTSVPEISPISRRVRMENIPKAGKAIEIIADESERAALADAHDLLALDRFEAELSLDHWRQDGFRLRGTIRADVTQQCVVTLVPLSSSLEVPVDVLLVPEGSRLAPAASEDELVIDFDSEDPPETFSGGYADIGAMCEELFALALDPYPRAPGVTFEDVVEADDSRPVSPFARLKDLGRKG